MWGERKARLGWSQPGKGRSHSKAGHWLMTEEGSRELGLKTLLSVHVGINSLARKSEKEIEGRLQGEKERSPNRRAIVISVPILG